MVLCSLPTKNKKESVKKKVLFTEDVKEPFKAGMMCTIDSDTFYSFTKIPGKETEVHHAISPMRIPVFMASLTLMS